MIFRFIFCFLVSLICSIIFAKFGSQWGFIDKPSDRSSHRIPIPRGGGIGILLVVLIGANWWDVDLSVWIPACFVSLVSFLGDYRERPIRIRLAAQMGAAAIFCGIMILKKETYGASAWIFISLVIFGIGFITATANYFNFMDGINGIAGVSGLIAFAGLGIYGLADGQNAALVSLAFGVAAACLGFLPLNFPKARVFMGDIGSVLLGFLFASLVIAFSWGIDDFIFLASFLFPFYADEISTLIVRLKDHDRITLAHRRHIYQILANQAGLSHACVTLIYGIFQITVIFLIWFARKEGLFYLISFPLALSALYFWWSIRIRRRWEIRRSGAF